MPVKIPDRENNFILSRTLLRSFVDAEGIPGQPAMDVCVVETLGVVIEITFCVMVFCRETDRE